MSSSRLDQELLRRGLAPSRTKAKDLIQSGTVSVNAKVITTASHSVSEDDQITLTENETLRYVSRAGLKLEGAIEETSFNFEGLRVLDIGQSTGGFTDCALQKGASEVIGIDVGHDQLIESLKHNSKVKFFEGINAKNLKEHLDKDAALAKSFEGGFDCLVVDVSFISLLAALEPAVEFLKPKASLLALVKPQFELGQNALNKKGVVTDQNLLSSLEEQIKEKISKLGLVVLNYFPTKVTGKEGNQEFFVYAQKP